MTRPRACCRIPPYLRKLSPHTVSPSLTAVYPNGAVCISILHPPGDDPLRYESASERWSPVQGVRSVLLSVLSMLAEPNIESGADIEVSHLAVSHHHPLLPARAVSANQLAHASAASYTGTTVPNSSAESANRSEIFWVSHDNATGATAYDHLVHLRYSSILDLVLSIRSFRIILMDPGPIWPTSVDTFITMIIMHVFFPPVALHAAGVARRARPPA
jgi:hypothetical protein